MLDCPVKRLSLSHAAARNIQGKTTHSFIARHVMYGNQQPSPASTGGAGHPEAGRLQDHLLRRLRPAAADIQQLAGRSRRGRRIRAQSALQVVVRLLAVPPDDGEALRQGALPLLHDPADGPGRGDREADAATPQKQPRQVEPRRLEREAQGHQREEAEDGGERATDSGGPGWRRPGLVSDRPHLRKSLWAFSSLLFSFSFSFLT